MAEKKKDKQLSTKHTHKTKDRDTRTPLKTGCEIRCSGRVGSSCTTSGTRRVKQDILSYNLESTIFIIPPNKQTNAHLSRLSFA